MNIQTIQNLFTQVSAINRQYEKIAELTGENFNIFKILGLTYTEVKHSAFLAELLNPNGTHGFGTIFANEFTEILKKKNPNIIFDFDAENAKNSQVEHWLGYNSDTEGGYIDILLTDNKNRHIIIENKINAGDQEHQLLRYHNFDVSAPIVYLTLYGKEPSDFSSGIEKSVTDKLICISYKTEILEWLEICKKEAVNHSLLRETLAQYINLIKHLTHQTMENKQKEEIIAAILNNSDYLETLQNLSENNIWDETKMTINLKLRNQLFGENGIGKELGLEEKFQSEKKFGTKEFDFWFYKNEWKYCIYFVFEDDYDNLSFGIDVISNDEKRLESEQKKFKEKLINFGISIDDNGWIWKSKFNEYIDSSWYYLQNHGRDMFKEKITKLIEQVGDLMKN